MQFLFRSEGFCAIIKQPWKRGAHFMMRTKKMGKVRGERGNAKGSARTFFRRNMEK